MEGQLAGTQVGTVLEHGRKFEQVKGVAILAHPWLAVKDLALAGEAQERKDDEPQGQDPGDEKGRKQKIRDAGGAQHRWARKRADAWRSAG